MTTNYERIKSMSVEEITKFLDVFSVNSCDFCGNWTKGCHFECEQRIKQWLESEAENEK